MPPRSPQRHSPQPQNTLQHINIKLSENENTLAVPPKVPIWFPHWPPWMCTSSRMIDGVVRGGELRCEVCLLAFSKKDRSSLYSPLFLPKWQHGCKEEVEINEI